MNAKKTIIQKYGGSSLATPERIKYIAGKIKERKDDAQSKNQILDMVIVVSAMGHQTNELLKLASEITMQPHQRELDMLLTSGERVSMSLMAMALNDAGVPAISFTGSQSGILTDTSHTKARIVEVKGFRIKDELNKGKTVVVAGFQGVSSDKEVTTLGRGGSDTTAVALAVYLGADLCEIYTDVNGVYTADPRIVTKSAFIKSCSYDEMMEMAFLGAKVLHYRSVELASKYNIPVVVRSSFNFNGGTFVNGDKKAMEEVLIRSITQDRDISKISILSVPEGKSLTSAIFNAIGEANVSVKFMVQSRGAGQEQNISFVVSRNDFDRAVKSVLKNIKNLTEKHVRVENDLARISVVGYGISHTPGIQGKIFSCLADEQIRIDDISSSNISISLLLKENEVDKAVRILHKELIENPIV